MPWWQFIIWNDDPGENVDKISQHGLTIEDVEYVLMNPKRRVTSKSSGRPAVYGYTPEWRGLSEPTALAAGLTSSVFRFEARG